MAELRHVYASVAEFDDYLRDNGATTFAAQSAAIVARKLAVLESVSRRIDEWCERSRFGSGFGPRTGTNRYDPPGSNCLYLWDDLLTITSVTTYDSPTASGTTLTDETDFFKRPYDRSPYRELLIHEDSSAVWGAGTRGNVIAGTWGYQDVRETLTPTISEALDASEPEIDVSALTGLSAGMTLLLDSEQVYVTATTDDTPDSITVERGVNGTTAATHLTGLAIARYVYPSAVHEVCLRIALKRWKARDAGADGTDGGGDVPVTTAREGEDTILRRGLDRLAYRSAS